MASVLVIRLSSLGDIVLTQPVLEQMHSSGWEVDLMVKPEYAELARLLPGVTRGVKKVDELRPSYNLVLDLHATLRARQIARQVKAQQVVHYDKHGLARRLLVRPGGHSVFWNAWPQWQAPVSVLNWYWAAAAQAGWIPNSRQPRLQVLPSALQAAQQLLAEAGIPPGKKIVLMAPGAKWPSKMWPRDYFIQTAALFFPQMDRTTVLLGNRAEQPLCTEIVQALSGQAVSLAGQTDLTTLAALFTLSDLLISNDSGPLHLGLAAGCRAVAIFGPTVAEFGFAPVSPAARILSQPLACRPCSLHGSQRCPLKHHACLKQILPSAVINAAHELLRLNHESADPSLGPPAQEIPLKPNGSSSSRKREVT